MNQDQIKTLLLKLDNNISDFKVILSGKKSKKVDGLYRPESQEIILHNKNFNSENRLIYTSIHEFAHHVQFVNSALPISCRAHTIKFWNILHNLLIKAEKLGVYNNEFKTNNEFIALTGQIKSKFMSTNGQLMKEFGELLITALRLCKQYDLSFEDYVDREIGLHRTAAKSIMNTYNMDINPEIGYDNMKTVASVKDENIRPLVEQAFLQGKSPDMVKAEFITHLKDNGKNKIELLEEEKERLRKNLERIKLKLADIEVKIREERGR